MTLLTWRKAQRDDRRLLTSFACTEPPRRERYVRTRTVYPRQWERDVEAYVRDFRPPGPPDQTFLIGLDDEGIGAVSAFVPDDPSWMIRLQILAVANRYRGQGGAVADEAITVARQAVYDAAALQGHSHVYISGLVHFKNRASQAMCQRHGFTCEDPEPDENGYQQWSVTVAFDQTPVAP